MLFHSHPSIGALAVWRIRIILTRIRIQDVKKFITYPANFDMDPDPGKNNTDPAKKDEVPEKSLKSDEKRS